MPFAKFVAGNRVIVKNWRHKDEKGEVTKCYANPGDGNFNYSVKFDDGQEDFGIEEKHMKPA